VLLVEDDPAQAAYVVKGLREAGHVVDHCANGADGLHLALTEPYDVALVDRMLPQLDGLQLIAAMRAQGRNTPALVVSALGQVDDRVRGLRAGGDDYIVKPYAFEELLARIDAAARRRLEPAQVAQLSVGDLRLDLLARSVTRGGHAIELKPQEFRLLEYMMRHAGQVTTRTMLLEGVWNYHFDPQTNVIDVHMSRLRAKIDRPPFRALIHTVRGAGYCLREEPGAAAGPAAAATTRPAGAG
jgi:two-component system OmpR family response regulator